MTKTQRAKVAMETNSRDSKIDYFMYIFEVTNSCSLEK